MRRNHVDVMIDMIHDRQLNVFAELGVNMSKMSKRVLQSRVGAQLREYWAIDPWVPFKDTNWPKAEGKYRHACQLMRWYPNLHVVRLDDLTAVKLFPDGYFDCVFIDTSHQYEHTKAELEAWEPKIRPGGILSGHDYHARREIHKGVTIAVDERYGDRVNEEAEMTWWIQL